MVYGLILLLIALLNLFLGLFVLSRGSDKEVNRTFCAWVISAAIWNFMDFGLIFSPNPQFALNWAKVLCAGVIFIPSTFFHFVVSFLKERGYKRRKLVPAGYIVSLIFIILTHLGFLIKDVIPLQKGYFPLFADAPSPQIFILFFYGFTLAGVFLLVKRLRRPASPIEENQLKYLLTGLSIAILGGISNFLLASGGERVFPIGNVAELAFISMTTIAILRYRLMDINLIIRPGIIYTSLTIVVTALWLGGIFLFERLLHLQALSARIMTIIIIVFLFNILRERIQLTVDRIFYRDRHELFQLQESVAKEMAATYDPDILLSSVLKRIEDALHPRFISAMLLSPDRRSYSVKCLMGEGEKEVALSVDEPIIKWLLKEKREIFSEEPDEDPEFDGLREGVKNGFKKTNAKLIVPLIYGDELTGILSLGEKKGRGYTYDEVTFLNTITEGLAIALENTKLYADLKERAAEIKTVNEQLQQEIIERKRAEEEVRRHRDHLEELVEERTRQLKEAETKLIESEKMAVAAKIASEAAHEIRNPLAVIKAGLYYLKKGLSKKEEDVQRKVDQMDGAVDRVSSYIDDLLNFSRPPALNLRMVKINAVLESSIVELPPGILTGLRIEKDLKADLPQIKADPARLREVFCNIIKNAQEAMEGEGTLRVKTDETMVKDEEFIRISFQDSGPGIKEEDLARVFEPFFTTKGNGTGLGLAICQHIIEAHNGEIEVESKIGHGATFIIRMRV